MEKQILENVSEFDRKQALKDSCVKMQQHTYARQLDEKELASLKDDLTQEDIKLDNLEKEKKEITTVFNNQIKEVKTERIGILTKVRSGIEEITEEVYLLDDQEEGKMGYYNSKGELVFERHLLQNERQHRINQLKKID